MQLARCLSASVDPWCACRFIHATDVDPSSLSWEDALALKYYETLFREFTVVNLKHYKHGAVRDGAAGAEVMSR